MGGMVGAHHLLGPVNAGDLILVAGPNFERMKKMVATAGIEARDASKVRDVYALKESVALRKTSLALLASVAEVEGILDRSIFGSHLIELAYEADRVVYYGMQGGVLMHPQYPGTRVEVRQGAIRVRQEALVAVTGGADASSVAARP